MWETRASTRLNQNEQEEAKKEQEKLLIVIVILGTPKRFTCLILVKSLAKMPVFTDKEIESGGTLAVPRSCQPRVTVGSDPVRGCTSREKQR